MPGTYDQNVSREWASANQGREDGDDAAWGGYAREEEQANAPFLQEHQNASSYAGGGAVPVADPSLNNPQGYDETGKPYVHGKPMGGYPSSRTGADFNGDRGRTAIGYEGGGAIPSASGRRVVGMVGGGPVESAEADPVAPPETGGGQEGGIPMAGAAQPAAAAPPQRMATAQSMVQSLLTHGMRKHNIIGPDGKPVQQGGGVGAYAAGGLVRSFADGGFIDDQNNDTEATKAPDAVDGGSEPQAQGAIPDTQGVQDAAVQPPAGPDVGTPASSEGPQSVASTGNNQPSVMQYVEGSDAPPDEVMDQLHASFGATGRPGNESALAAVAAAGEKSPDLGFSVLQGYRKRYDKHRRAAAQALDQGDLDTAVSSLNEAYNNLPTDENANFSHDGKNLNASVNGNPYQISPKLASGLLAKGTAGHFDNSLFAGLDASFQPVAASSAAAEKMAAGAYPGGRPANSSGAPSRAPQGTQVAGPPDALERAQARHENNASRENQNSDRLRSQEHQNSERVQMQGSIATQRGFQELDQEEARARAAHDAQRQKEDHEIWMNTNHPEWMQKGSHQGDDEQWNHVYDSLVKQRYTPAEIDDYHQNWLKQRGGFVPPRGGAPAPQAAPQGGAKPAAPAQATPQKAPSTGVPAGMQLMINRKTGEQKLVPIGQ